MGEEGEKPTGDPPSVLGRRLGEELRRHRVHAGLTPEAAAAAGDVPVATIEHLEMGHSEVQPRTLADLLTRYGVRDGVERAELISLARRDADPGWWHSFADILPPQLETYLRLERATSLVRSYDPHLIPRLLQTRDYALATLRLAFAELGTTHLGITRTEDVERQIDIRMHRQRLLDEPDGPTLWAVVDEAALRQRLGDPETSRAQLDHLLEITERPRVTLQVVPAGTAGPLAANTPFTLMRFPQRFLPDVAYVEQTTRPLYLDKRPDVDHYTILMDRLVARAEKPARTAAVLSRIRSEF